VISGLIAAWVSGERQGNMNVCFGSVAALQNDTSSMSSSGCKADSLEQASRSAKIERLLSSKAVVQLYKNSLISRAAFGQKRSIALHSPITLMAPKFA